MQDNYKNTEPPLVTLIKQRIAESAAEHASSDAADPRDGKSGPPPAPRLGKVDPA